MTTLALRTILVSAAAIVISGCGGENVQIRAARSKLAGELAGDWEARFRLDRSPRLTAPVSSSKADIVGRFAFLVNRSLGASYPGLATLSNYGTYDIDFTSFGFDPRDSGRTPTAVAGPIDTDSLEIMLSPDEEGVVMRMRGRLVGDTIRGTWSVVFPRAGAGGGTFTMTSLGSRRF
jgi:hypothetical protein